MSAGRVQQIATPKEMFDNPSNLFVATFIGTPPMNLINVVVTADGYANVVDSKNKLKISDEKFALLKKLGYESSLYSIFFENLFIVGLLIIT
jgi:multiple sugar transport system ATP-binding protein